MAEEKLQLVVRVIKLSSETQIEWEDRDRNAAAALAATAKHTSSNSLQT